MKKKKIKDFLSDLFFSASGLVFMNAVISFLIYPMIRKLEGSAFQGRVLFFVSLANLAAGAFGSGANYGRMKIYAEERRSENGDSNWFLLFTAAVSLVLTLIAVLVKKDTADTVFPVLALLVFLTSLRMYADVEFRLSLKYKRFSLYYAIIGAGYLAGYGIWRLTGFWPLIFLLGEAAGLLYVALTGSVFRRPWFRRSDLFRKNFSTDLKVSASFFMSDLVGASDRFLFPVLLSNGDELTSLYYYASIMGKLMSLLSTPLNGVLNGYISKEEGRISRKTYGKVLLGMLGLFAAVTLLAVGVSYGFVRVFYPQDFDKARPLFLLANAGQVIFFVCNTLMVVVLRYTKERNQLIVNGLYILLFFVLTVPMILRYGLWGMAWGIFIVNAVRFLLYAGIGLISLKGEEAS
ncbi:MAG: hypothetical protein IIY77_01790 [Lachnospiraceae bacterium]|nr:hypothetical protein [Lachnospiraceae bacterium]